MIVGNLIDCKLDRYNRYLDHLYGHIVTGNLNIVEDDNLRNFMNLGSKCRLDFNYSCNKILESFEEDVDIFILKLDYKYVSPIESFLKWKSENCEAYKSKIIFYDNYLNKNKANYKVNSLFNSIKYLKNKYKDLYICIYMHLLKCSKKFFYTLTIDY